MTSDPDAEFAFYSDLFGWEKAQAVDMGPMGTYQVFAHDGAQIGGVMGLGNSPVPAWLPYFGVTGVEAAIARIAAAGGRLAHGPVEVPGGAFIAVAQDPQGAWFAVVGPGKGDRASPGWVGLRCFPRTALGGRQRRARRSAGRNKPAEGASADFLGSFDIVMGMPGLTVENGHAPVTPKACLRHDRACPSRFRVTSKSRSGGSDVALRPDGAGGAVGYPHGGAVQPGGVGPVGRSRSSGLGQRPREGWPRPRRQAASSGARSAARAGGRRRRARRPRRRCRSSHRPGPRIRAGRNRQASPRTPLPSGRDRGCRGRSGAKSRRRGR